MNDPSALHARHTRWPAIVTAIGIALLAVTGTFALFYAMTQREQKDASNAEKLTLAQQVQQACAAGGDAAKELGMACGKAREITQRGEKGEPGATGPMGPAGPRGPRGVPGQRGPAGSTPPCIMTSTHCQGRPGLDGDPGPQGPAGADGTNGADGSPGDPGPAGPEGPAGPAGPTGPAGADGRSITAVTCDAIQPVTFTFTFSDGSTLTVECGGEPQPKETP
jgi:Collagen triple helix repeat (20 copies)